MIRGMKWSNSEIRIKINYPLHLFTYRSIFFSYYDAHLKFYFGGKVVKHVTLFLPSILKTHFQEKSVVPAGSSPVILVMLEMR